MCAKYSTKLQNLLSSIISYILISHLTTLASFPFCSLWHIFIHIVLFIHVYMYVIESSADRMPLAVIWPTNIFKWHCNSSNSKKEVGEREGQFCRFIVSFIRAFYPHPSMHIYYVYAYDYHICLCIAILWL